MRYLLDTNAVIALLKGTSSLSARIRSKTPQDFALSAVAAHELFFGAYKSERMARNLAQVEGLQFEVLEFDKEDARKAGEIRAVLAGAGTPIGPYDVLIAGQAMARDLTLITRNVAGFSRIASLQVEDWEL